MQLLVEHFSSSRLYRFREIDAVRTHEAALDAQYFPNTFYAALAFNPPNFIDALGVLVYTTTDEVLVFRYIYVVENMRRQEVAKTLIDDVVLHPSNILLPSIAATAGSVEGHKLSSYISALPGKLQRICGTSFSVKTTPYPWA